MNILGQLADIKISTNDIGIPKVEISDATIGDVMGAVFVLTGAIAVLFVLIGAVRYVTSGGDQGHIKQAKETILYALIGVVVSLAAFTIVQFTLGKLGGHI